MFPAAKQECLEIVAKVAEEAEGTGIAELFRGERERLGDYPIGEYLRSMSRYAGPWEWWGSERLAYAGLQAFADEIS